MAAATTDESHVTGSSIRLLPYTPPVWASGLNHHPKHRIQLCQLPTPVHEWPLTGFVSKGTDVEIFIKRDDITAPDLLGSKARKMEFLMASALARGCDSVITTGAMHSNHCRNTALASRQVGLQPYLMLRTSEKDTPVNHQGNLLLARLTGAKIYLVEAGNDFDYHSLDRELVEYGNKLRTNNGLNPFVISLNEVDVVGFWGYIQLYQELLDQGVKEFDHVFVGCASGGTVLGIALGTFLTGSNTKVHAICACETAEYYYNEIDKYLEQMIGLAMKDSKGYSITSHDLPLEIHDKYIGLGYTQSTDKELELMAKIATQTGVILDHIYTVKTVKGMLTEINTKPCVYKGKKVLFVHTGGIYNLQDDEYWQNDEQRLTKITKLNQIVTAEQIFD